MRLPRTTIASLLGVVALVGVAFAALREATEDWDSTLLGLTLVMLLASALLAVHRSGERRAYWLGFSLSGWAYLVASLVPPVASWLPTSKALPVLGEMMRARPEFLMGNYLTSTRDLLMFDVPTAATTAPKPPVRWVVAVFQRPASPIVNSIKPVVGIGEATGNFARIGHSLFALVFALIGALFSRRLYLGPGITKGPASRPPLKAPAVTGHAQPGVPTTLEVPRLTTEGSGSPFVVPIPQPWSRP